MKKDLEEILNCITPETPIEEALAYRDTAVVEDKAYPLSDELKQKVLRLVKIAEHFNTEITTAYLQRVLEIPYPQALALYEWLKNEDHI